MNLPPSNNDVAYGQLVVGGSLDLFYWDGDFDIRGDVSAHEGTDLHLSLLTDEEAGWNSTVEFLKPPSDCSHAHEPDNVQEDELGVLIDLSLEANPDAKITILTDPENNANIVGFTEGTLHVLMDDWEHLTLNGELSIVEGRYDLAFGPFVRKTFVAQPGGRLFGMETHSKEHWIWTPSTRLGPTSNHSWAVKTHRSKTRMSRCSCTCQDQ